MDMHNKLQCAPACDDAAGRDGKDDSSLGDTAQVETAALDSGHCIAFWTKLGAIEVSLVMSGFPFILRM
eukprot:6304866-Amphidinium_carterae.1